MRRQEDETITQVPRVGPSRSRREEEPLYIGGGISSPAITGYFISVDVPEVQVGEDIKATIDFYAINPGAWYWSTFLVVDSPGLGLTKLLDKAREIGQEGGRKKTYTLGKMPNRDIAISFFLFAHDDATYDWNWSEYYAWLEGWPVGFTRLDSEYVFISPAPVPPEPVIISGVITKVEPAKVTFGNPIDLSVNFNAYCESLTYQIKGWETKLTAQMDGLLDSDIQYHLGRDGSRTGQTLHLGVMPNRNLSGTLILEGRRFAVPPYPWEELDRVSLAITVVSVPTKYQCPYCDEYFITQAELEAHIRATHPGEPVPPPPPPEEEAKVPWVPIALIGGGAVLVAAGLKPKKKKA